MLKNEGKQTSQKHLGKNDTLHTGHNCHSNIDFSLQIVEAGDSKTNI